MPPARQKKSRKAQHTEGTGSSVVGLLAVAAVAAAGFWWWRRRQQPGGRSGGRSSFKFPAPAQQASSGAPRGKGTGNNKKKDKARKKEEKARRAEKREKVLDGAQQAVKGDEQPQSTSVINYTYFDSARKDSLLPAAKKKPSLTAADAVKLQQDAASGSGGGEKRK